MRVGGPWLPNNCQNLDSDLFDTIYDTRTHFKCYKTSLHLQDLENQQDCTSECLYFKFFREACPQTYLQFSKKSLSPLFFKACHGPDPVHDTCISLNMKFKCVVSLYVYFLKLKITAASEKIIRLLFHCLLCGMAAIFYELSWQMCFDFSR